MKTVDIKYSFCTYRYYFKTGQEKDEFLKQFRKERHKILNIFDKMGFKLSKQSVDMHTYCTISSIKHVERISCAGWIENISIKGGDKHGYG